MPNILYHITFGLFNVSAEDTYNHLDETTETFQGVKLDPGTHLTQSYDHLDSWSSRTKSVDSVESTQSQYHTAESSPMWKTTAADDVFASGPAKMTPAVYRDIPPNYEDPWDSQTNQMHFNRVLNRAEKTHERRQSVEKTSSSPGSRSSDSLQSAKSASDAKLSPQIVPKKEQMIPECSYEAAWGSGTSQRKQSDSSNSAKPNPVSKPNPVPKPTPVSKPNIVSKPSPHANIPSNYEDAWDLPEKQKEFEEKLQKARIERASKGQIREEGDDEVFANMAEVAKQRSEKKSSIRVSVGSPISPTSEYCFSNRTIDLLYNVQIHEHEKLV